MSTYKGFEIELSQDSDPFNPRKEFDPAGKMVCFHKKYDLGDEHDYKHGDYNSWDELKAGIEANEKVALILPVYMYDHSGITIATKPFGCKWDSGQIGFIYLTEKEAKDIPKDQWENVLQGEIKEYDSYLRGDVWGYKINKDGEELEACSGFYGEEYCLTEAKSQCDYLLRQDKKM